MRSKTRCHPSNSCAGGYGQCMDVKLTNVCDGQCAFCIEKDGHSPAPTDIITLAQRTIAAQDCQTILVLGGEPCLHPDLSEYLRLIHPFKKEIYLTTNGGNLTSDKPVNDPAILASCLTAINISIHHYDEAINDSIYNNGPNGPFHCDFSKLPSIIATFHDYGKTVRINTVLSQQGIHDKPAIQRMLEFALSIGADEIKFAEMQNASDNLYVDAYPLFPWCNRDPYTEGCQTCFDYTPSPETGCSGSIRIWVKQSCGRVNSRKPMPTDKRPPRYAARVLYPDGTVTKGWVKSVTKPEQATDTLAQSTCGDCHNGGCHGPSYETDIDCHSCGCHG